MSTTARPAASNWNIANGLTVLRQYRQAGGTAFVGSSPELFGYWVERMAAQTRERHAGDARLMFVNAWNEWGEGCHLEPDERYGRQYLQALARALRAQQSA